MPLQPGSLPPVLPPAQSAPGGGASWVRYLPLFFIPVILVGVMVVSVILDQPKPLAPECAAALRCCLATANVSPPVAFPPLKRCVKIATGPAASCSAALSEARGTAQRAGVRCDTSPVRAYDSYRWTEQASTAHAASDQRAPRVQLYPRVSCRKAALRLAKTVKEQKDGAWVAVRPLDLMIVALSLDDPEAVIYCDGYPLPAADPRQADRTKPIWYPKGPHAVMMRPLKSGRFRVAQYCLGCNRVGKEPKRGP